MHGVDDRQQIQHPRDGCVERADVVNARRRCRLLEFMRDINRPIRRNHIHRPGQRLCDIPRLAQHLRQRPARQRPRRPGRCVQLFALPTGRIPRHVHHAHAPEQQSQHKREHDRRPHNYPPRPLPDQHIPQPRHHPPGQPDQRGRKLFVCIRTHASGYSSVKQPNVEPTSTKRDWHLAHVAH